MYRGSLLWTLLKCKCLQPNTSAVMLIVLVNTRKYIIFHKAKPATCSVIEGIAL